MGKNVWGFGRVPGFAAFAFGGRSRFFESGEVRLAVLSLLSEGPKHGYALTKDIETFAGVRLAPGTLYEALSRLEGQGFIEALESHDRRRPYRLTAAGRKQLQAETAKWNKMTEIIGGILETVPEEL